MDSYAESSEFNTCGLFCSQISPVPEIKLQEQTEYQTPTIQTHLKLCVSSANHTMIILSLGAQ
jgi:hypothetical protein